MAKAPVCGFKLERAARKLGFLRIAGCDEVGRGPMFGPVVAAAVILVLQVPVIEIVHVTLVANCGVPARRAMLVGRSALR